MKSNYLLCEGREIHFVEWGAERREAVIAWHRLARRRGPRAELVTIAGCGHAPALNAPDQLNLVERFLGAQ